MSATKHDQGKPRMELLPPKALEEISKVLDFGAKKYGDFNWLGGFGYSRLIGACLRHVFEFVGGANKDKESGLHPLAHAACCLLFLLEFIVRDLGTDDRGYAAKSVKNAAEEVMEEHKETLERLADDKPLVLREGGQYVRRDGKTTAPLIQGVGRYNYYDPRHGKTYTSEGIYDISRPEADEDLIEELP